jgi:type IV pilus assembly protein PilM
MDVLPVAAKKDMINDYTTVVSEADCSRWWWDIDSSPSRTCSLPTTRWQTPNGGADQRRGLGGEHQHPRPRGHSVFTRDVTIRGNQFTEEIQKQLNVSYEEAEALKIGGGRGESDAVVPRRWSG